MEMKKSFRCSLHNFLKIYSTCLKNDTLQEFFSYLKQNKFYNFLIHLGKKGEACNGLSEEETIIFADAVNRFRQEGFDCNFEEGFTPEQALYASRKLSEWANEIKNAKVQGRDLTVLEKFLYAYDISSNFVYKKNDTDENGKQIDVYASRNVIRVLNGDKIVCVGFAHLLKELCDRLNIPCMTISLKAVKIGESGHCLCIVYINDPVYKIKGTCMSDPTYASIKKSNKRNFAMSIVAPENLIGAYKKQYKFAQKNYLEDFITKTLSLKEKRELDSYHSLSLLREHEEKNVKSNFNLINKKEFSQKLESVMEQLNTTKNSLQIPLNDDYKEYFYDVYAQLLKKSMRTENIIDFVDTQEFKSDLLAYDINLFFEEMKKNGFAADYITQKVISKLKLDDKKFIDSLFKDYDIKPPKKYKDMSQNLPWLSNPHDINNNFANALYNVGIAKGKTVEQAIAYANSRMHNYSEETEHTIAKHLTAKQIDDFLDFISNKDDEYSDLF